MKLTANLNIRVLNSGLIYLSSKSNKGKTALIYSFSSYPIDSSYLLLFLAKYILSIVLWVLANDNNLTFHGLISEPSYLLTFSPYPTTGNDSIKSYCVLQKSNPSKKSFYWKTSFWFWRVKIEDYCLLSIGDSLVLLNTSVNSLLISKKSLTVIPFKASAFWWYFPVIVPIPSLLAASY